MASLSPRHPVEHAEFTVQAIVSQLPTVGFREMGLIA